MGVTNLFILDFLNKCKLKYFSGVFSSNKIPNFLSSRKNFAFVCNLAHSTVQYGHFITITGNEHNVFYCDPLGLPCFNKKILNFLKKCNKPILFNSDKIQSNTSQYCGFFSILFILLYNYPTYVKQGMFSLNLSDNNIKCIKYIKKIVENKS